MKASLYGFFPSQFHQLLRWRNPFPRHVGFRYSQSRQIEPASKAEAEAPLPECPIRVEARKIPENFLDGFRERDCASLDCQTSGYCERIAAQAVSIASEYRSEVLRKYAEMDDTMVAGGLWGV